jgi:hypothetical protein
MTQDQPAVMVDDGSGNPVDRHNLRTAAWGGLIALGWSSSDRRAPSCHPRHVRGDVPDLVCPGSGC